MGWEKQYFRSISANGCVGKRRREREESKRLLGLRGYSGEDYFRKSGKQITAVNWMIDCLTGAMLCP